MRSVPFLSFLGVKHPSFCCCFDWLTQWILKCSSLSKKTWGMNGISKGTSKCFIRKTCRASTVHILFRRLSWHLQLRSDLHNLQLRLAWIMCISSFGAFDLSHKMQWARFPEEVQIRSKNWRIPFWSGSWKKRIIRAHKSKRLVADSISVLLKWLWPNELDDLSFHQFTGANCEGFTKKARTVVAFACYFDWASDGQYNALRFLNACNL